MLYLSSLIFVEINDMHFKKLFTTDINNPYKNIEFVNSSSEINNPDGTIVFSLKNIEVPKQFSQVAIDILAQKYFRKAGVPVKLKKVEENNVPPWLWRSVPDNKNLSKLNKEKRFTGETSAKQAID